MAIARLWRVAQLRSWARLRCLRKAVASVAAKWWRGDPITDARRVRRCGLMATLSKRADDLPRLDREFISQGIECERKARRREQRVRAVAYGALVGIIIGLIGWINQSYIKEQMNWYLTMRPYMLTSVRPYVLSLEAERALNVGQSFRECAKDCPEMIVIPAGKFLMGSPATEPDPDGDQKPQHSVTISKRFAVSKFDVTFADWDACISVRNY